VNRDVKGANCRDISTTKLTWKGEMLNQGFFGEDHDKGTEHSEEVFWKMHVHREAYFYWLCSVTYN